MNEESEVTITIQLLTPYIKLSTVNRVICLSSQLRYRFIIRLQHLKPVANGLLEPLQISFNAVHLV